MEALMWISRSEQPFGSRELCHALGVELGAEDFSIENVPSIRTVIGYTLGLVTIDETASRPRLLHFTLQEYIGEHPTLFVTAHSMMAEICLTYLNSRSIRELRPNLDTVRVASPFSRPQCPGLDDALRETPFLEYATCFWGAHATRGATEPVKYLALRLLDRYENHVSAAVLWRKKIGYWDRDVQGITGLHCIAFWGIAEIASTMLERKGWQVNGQDSRSETPLMWAVKYKNIGMVELFLGQEDIEPDTVIKDGRTVFSFAAELGNEDAVKLLLGRRDVNHDSKDSDGRTPLSFAAELGQGGVVKLLLERGDVDPNSRDSHGRTPLSFAAEWGREGVVKLLLERGDTDPNSSANNGRTPFSFVAQRFRDLFSLAPRYEDVMKLLLERGGGDPNSPDSNGRTLVSFAAGKGRERLVKLLLGRGDVDPNSSGNYGRTPLSFAAGNGRKGVVKLLLERGDVDPNLSDNNGRTPFSFACGIFREPNHFRRRFSLSQIYEGLMKLPLKRGGGGPNSPDSNSPEPLSNVGMGGRGGVSSLLSGSIIPYCEPSGTADRMPACIAGENASLGEATHPLTPTEHTPLNTIDDQLFGAFISYPAPYYPPLPYLRLIQPPPEQLYSPPHPPAPILTSGSSSAFPFFLRSLILFIFLYLALMICDGYRDSLELLYVISLV